MQEVERRVTSVALTDEDELEGAAPEQVQVPGGTGPNSDAQVIYGASVQTLPLAGLTVRQARAAAVAVLGVDPNAPVLVNGVPVRATYCVAPGDTVEFVHHAGEKGAARGSAG